MVNPWRKCSGDRCKGTNSCCHEAAPDVEGEGKSEEGQTKVELLNYAYEQVLDATKHQDDKVGRLLTTVAFLTAASLALAGLAGSRAIVVPVNLGGETAGTEAPVSIALVFFVAFLISVSVVVIQLIGSLSTPLRLPGLDPIRRAARDRKDQSDNSPNSVSSLIYFHEIEKNTREEWERTWQASTSDLQAREQRSLVAETHNLALRTSFKYNRTNEATAVLTGALMALSLTVVFIAIIVLDETNPLGAPTGGKIQTVTLNPGDMVFIGSVLAAITFVWSIARMRQSRLGRDHEGSRLILRLQRAVVLGLTISVFVSTGLPATLSETRWPDLYPIAVAFLATFTGGSISWSIWAQSRTDRVNSRSAALFLTTFMPMLAGVLLCASYKVWSSHGWTDGLPLACGWIGGAVAAWVFSRWARDKGEDEDLPKRRTVRSMPPLPPHEGTSESCDRCKQELSMDSGQPLRWRVLAVMFFAIGFSFVAQRFQFDLAYEWPLAATCSALVVLVGAAVLDPTFMERRERLIKKRRAEHNEARRQDPPRTRP